MNEKQLRQRLEKLTKELSEYKAQHRDMAQITDALIQDQEDFLELLCRVANGEMSTHELAVFIRQYFPRTSKQRLLREPLRKVGSKLAEFKLRPELFMPKFKFTMKKQPKV